MKAFGIPLKVGIPSQEHQLLIWSMTLEFKGPICCMDGSRMAGRPGAGVCGVRPGKKLSFILGVHASGPGGNF